MPFGLVNPLVYAQESPRKQVGLTEDGPGQIQEVKAIQQTRRLLANARERTRVHTISAAFEALRKQVRILKPGLESQPSSYSHDFLFIHLFYSQNSKVRIKSLVDAYSRQV